MPNLHTHLTAPCGEIEHRYQPHPPSDGLRCIHCGLYLPRAEFDQRTYLEQMPLAELQKRLAAGTREGLPLRWCITCTAWHVPAGLSGAGPFSLEALRPYCLFDYESAQRWAAEHHCHTEDDRQVCEHIIFYQCPTPGCTVVITATSASFGPGHASECYSCFAGS